MSDRPRYDFDYVHTDIPEGMTIREWRAHRAAEQTREQQAARDTRGRRSVRDRLLAAGRAGLAEPRHPRRAYTPGAGA